MPPAPSLAMTPKPEKPNQVDFSTDIVLHSTYEAAGITMRVVEIFLRPDVVEMVQHEPGGEI